MSEWVRSIIYLGNFGAGILFASHIACMKLGSRDKKTTFGRIEDVISGFLCKISGKMGIPEEKTKDFTAITIFFTILCLAVAVTAGIIKGFIILIPCVICIYLMKKAWEKNIGEMFQKNAYRLYRYLVSQITAGVKPKDVIINMYKITEDKSLKKILTRASAAYSITLDGKTYSDVIKSSIKTEDADRFCMILEEDLLYTDNEEFLEKMEEMMFNRHFSYHQKKTDSIKRGCFAAVCVFMLIVIIMVALPLITELVQGLKYIFS
jgi:hypothetical protein